MSALAEFRDMRARASLELNTELLDDLNNVLDDPSRGAHFAAGALAEALRKASAVIRELLYELADGSAS